MTGLELRRRGHLAQPSIDQVDHLAAIADRHHARLYEIRKDPTADNLEQMILETQGLHHFLVALLRAAKDLAGGGKPPAA